MPLSIYTASAGSGKTYALTYEYLQTLLSQPLVKNAYKQLLAITFTNKAADEMKTRIMERLNSIACSTDTQASADDEKLCADLSITPIELRKRALALRSAILHDYSHFAISTIDAFFQKIVRTLLHELKLLPNFNLELDNDQILDKAIDALRQEAATNESLRKRLTNLTNQRIRNGKSWNTTEQLREIGKETFKESFRNMGSNFMGKIGDTDFLKNYEKQLQKIISNFTKTMQDCGSQALAILQENNIATTDFKHKSKSFANYFNKIKNAQEDDDYMPKIRAMEALGNEEKWLTGNSGKDAIIQSTIFPSVNPLLEKAIACYQKESTAYRTAREIVKNLYSLTILADIANKVAEISGNENSLLLGDTLYLLRTLIGENDTSFVYEKAGVYYQSFMLDEFQDTSNVQWESLRPLLLNGLSEGGKILAVGDIKQSIYRWRNGDWQILAKGIFDYFNAYKPQKITLDTNWRSKEIIVETNNLLFSKLPVLLQEKLNQRIDETAHLSNERIAKLRTIITEAYTTTEQKVAPTKTGSGGYVQIETIANTSKEDISTKEITLEKLIHLISELQDRGYRASDIAILVRKQREGQEIADALLQHKKKLNNTNYCFDVVSQDSLFLAHAQVVQFIIAVLHLTITPNDTINRTIANRYLEEYSQNKKITSDFLEKLFYLPLSEAIEKIIAYFDLQHESSNWVFLQELHEVIQNFANREHNDVYNFLEHWKKQGLKCTLSMTAKRDTLQILTIHKSKGLQFPVVIIPFCNWNIEPKTNSLMWVKAEQEPFSGPDYLPLNYTSALAKTFFSTDYLEEQAQSAIDNLNLLYVAFTRAEEELYTFIPTTKQKKENRFASILLELIQSESFTAGAQTKVVRKKSEEKPFTLTNYPSYSYTNRLCTKYTEQNTSDISTTGIRDYGVLMHRAFSHIATINDVDKAIAKLVDDGFLPDNEIQRNSIKEKITEALQQPNVSKWFDGSWRLLNEANLLLPATTSTQQLRPDRVMFRNDEVVVIDYKFGKNKLEKYTQQIQNYINTIKQMGYTNIKGYCWYIALNEIEEIHL